VANDKNHNKKTRTRKAPEVRQREIMAAAVGLFARQGYWNTELQEVADTLGIAKGTIYLYFETKKDLYFAALDHALDQLADMLHAEVTAASGPVEKIRALVTTYFRFFDEDRALAEVIAQGCGEFRDHAEQTHFRIFAENRTRFKQIVQEGMAGGVFRQTQPQRTVEIMANLMHGTIYTHAVQRTQASLSEIADGVTDFFLHGLLARYTPPAPRCEEQGHEQDA